MANQKRKRRARPAGEVVTVTKKAVTSDALEDGGKKNPKQGVPSGSGVRPKGKPDKIRIIDVKELRQKSMVLPDEILDLPKDTAAKVFKGEVPLFGGETSGRFLIACDGEALGILELEKGSVASLAKFSEPMLISDSAPVEKQALDNTTPIEGLPLQDLLDAHWDIHMMWYLKAINKDHPKVKTLSPMDITNLHARIVDAMMFRGEKHPPPPDNGLDLYSFDLERFAAKQPRHFQPPKTGGKIPLVKAIDPFFDLPPEDGLYRFCIQNHFEGSHFHSDLRLGYKPDEMLLGWRLSTQAYNSACPVVSSTKEAAIVGRDEEINLIDWKSGEWRAKTIAADPRPPHPWVWLNVQGKTATPDGEEGRMVPGSGWKHPGVFLIVDKGEVEFGLQTATVREYFLKGDTMNYRVVGRIWDHTNAAPVAAAKSEGGYNLPPEDERTGEDIMWEGQGPWSFSKEDDPRPEVLSKEAAMPPDGFSALPLDVRKKVPARFQYWKKGGDTARDLRDKLVDAIASGEVKLDFEAPFKRAVKKCSMAGARFVWQDWRDPGAPDVHKHILRVDVGRDEHLVVKVAKHASGTDGQEAEVYGEALHELMEVVGEIRPSHYLNREKKITYDVNKMDEGDATVMSLTDGFVRIAFNGAKLRGVFDIRKQDGKWLYYGKESKEIGATTPEDYVDIIKFAEEGEERLVTGIVLEPDEVDTQNDTIKAKAIKDTAHGFLAKYNSETKLGIQHQTFGAIGVELVESYIAPEDMIFGEEKVKKGSWLITVKVVSDQVWEKVKSGELTGFSIGGLATVA